MTGWEYKKGKCHLCNEQCDPDKYTHEECFNKYFN